MFPLPTPSPAFFDRQGLGVAKSFALDAQSAMTVQSPVSAQSHADFYIWATTYLLSLGLVQHFSQSSSAPFLQSEWLCWTILFAFALYAQRHRRFLPNEGQNQADKLALAIAATAVCWAWGEAKWAVVCLEPLSDLVLRLRS